VKIASTFFIVRVSSHSFDSLFQHAYDIASNFPVSHLLSETQNAQAANIPLP
jgi:hypothetical protein